MPLHYLRRSGTHLRMFSNSTVKPNLVNIKIVKTEKQLFSKTLKIEQISILVLTQCAQSGFDLQYF